MVIGIAINAKYTPQAAETGEITIRVKCAVFQPLTTVQLSVTRVADISCV